MGVDVLRQELSDKRLDELRGLARELGLKGVSSAAKAVLIDRLIQDIDPAVLRSHLRPKPRQPVAPTAGEGYRPALWEKICAVAMAMGVILLVGLLVVRNQPIADTSLIVLMRIVLSLAVAILGATIPGFLQIDLSVKGVLVRAGGALALFVLTYFFSPTVPGLAGPKTTFQLWDSGLDEPVLRDFELQYSLDGQSGRTTSTGSRGTCVVEADGEAIAVQDVICPGYFFDPQAGPASRRGPVRLALSRDEWEFLDKIEPANPYAQGNLPSPEAYQQAVASEVPAKDVVLTCVNQTRYHVDLILHRYLPWDERDDRFPEDLIALHCPPEAPAKYDKFGRRGGFYFIFASTLGQQALALLPQPVHLYQTPRPTIYVEPGVGFGSVRGSLSSSVAVVDTAEPLADQLQTREIR